MTLAELSALNPGWAGVSGAVVGPAELGFYDTAASFVARLSLSFPFLRAQEELGRVDCLRGSIRPKWDDYWRRGC